MSLDKTTETRGQTYDEHKRNAEVVTGIQTTGTKSYEHSGKELRPQLELRFRPNAARIAVVMKTKDLWKIFQLQEGVNNLRCRTRNFVMSVEHSYSPSSSWHSEIQMHRTNGLVGYKIRVQHM